ncbi:hypothetical protein ACFY05_41970 [Microtetraspora fusca]|uniref:Uncharacterized protein n=1 Tax=Microtetraspora fusca TaxID=1997 RepID=A0ABW6VJ57_MICFU
MAFKTWTVGEVLTSADLNRYAVQQAFVIKAADKSIASNTVLQDDDHLFLALAANTRYLIESMIRYNGLSGPVDFKVGWSAPAGATFDWVCDGLDPNVTGPTGGVSRNRLTLADTASAATISADAFILARGVLTTAAVAGNLQFRWAQDSSNSNALVVRAGSLLQATRLTP